MTRTWIVVCFLLMAMTSQLFAGTSATSFTYQGELQDGAALANGTYDLEISLWDALSGGGQLGSNIVLNNVPISDGKLSVELDFGASAFNNEARWLEIAVKGVTLSPRQPITRAPYSIQTRGINVESNGCVGIGTTAPQAAMHVANPLPLLYLQDTDGTGNLQTGYLSLRDSGGSERAWMGYGSLANSDLTVANNACDVILYAVGHRLVFTVDGNLGVGALTPQHKLHARSPFRMG